MKIWKYFTSQKKLATELILLEQKLNILRSRYDQAITTIHYQESIIHAYDYLEANGYLKDCYPERIV